MTAVGFSLMMAFVTWFVSPAVMAAPLLCTDQPPDRDTKQRRRIVAIIYLACSYTILICAWLANHTMSHRSGPLLSIIWGAPPLLTIIGAVLYLALKPRPSRSAQGDSSA